MRLPTHSPEIIACGVQRTLCDNEFSGRIVTWNKVCVDVIGSFFVVCRLEFDSGMVVGKDVGESVFGSVARQIGVCAWFVSTDMFQFFVFFAEAEI